MKSLPLKKVAQQMMFGGFEADAVMIELRKYTSLLPSGQQNRV